jgi:hypothetical protein
MNATTARPSPRHVLALAGLGLALLGAAAWADTGQAERRAAAPLQLSVTVPAVLRVRENTHPTQLHPGEHGEGVAPQRLVVFSNLPGGFCVRLTLTDTTVRAWALRAVADAGATWRSPAPGVRELCLHSPGAHTLEIEHRFGYVDGLAQRWPVLTDISAL